MNAKPILYIKIIWDMVFGERLKSLIQKARYSVELDSKNGYLINGQPNYWGRYGTLKKIVELAQNMPVKDFVSFYLPAIQSNNEYSHRVNINKTEPNTVIIEFEFYTDQSGIYEKTVELSVLEYELSNLKRNQIDVTKMDYKYIVFQDD